MCKSCLLNILVFHSNPLMIERYIFWATKNECDIYKMAAKKRRHAAKKCRHYLSPPVALRFPTSTTGQSQRSTCRLWLAATPAASGTACSSRRAGPASSSSSEGERADPSSPGASWGAGSRWHTQIRAQVLGHNMGACTVLDRAKKVLSLKVFKFLLESL